VRTGEEFNGNWMPWKAEGKEKVFAAAFRRFVNAFRSVSGRFRFEWNVSVGDYGASPEEAYPGDDVVDIIGMDFYHNLKWNDPDPLKAWDYMVNRRFGLAWHQDFAIKHQKPTAYSEWGISSNDSAPFIEKAKAWFDSHNVLYQIYWDSNADFRGKLSSGQFPNSGAAFKAAFGKP
jgi:beta-mannanase